jgi:hypothetical protein
MMNHFERKLNWVSSAAGQGCQLTVILILYLEAILTSSRKILLVAVSTCNPFVYIIVLKMDVFEDIFDFHNFHSHVGHPRYIKVKTITVPPPISLGYREVSLLLNLKLHEGDY